MMFIKSFRLSTVTTPALKFGGRRIDLLHIWRNKVISVSGNHIRRIGAAARQVQTAAGQVMRNRREKEN
jgi:hypothetical protein